MKKQKGITLVVLTVTIIVLIILAGVVVNFMLNRYNIFEITKGAKETHEEQQAKEKLELVLLDLQADKVDNSEYNENEYIDNRIKENGMQIEKSIVIVDGWQFEIDRSVPKIIANLGKEIPEVVPDGWIGIYNETDLRNVANDLTAKYIVMKDIEITNNWKPIGDNTNKFKGSLEGNYHKITGLKNASNIATDYQGLFGYIDTGGKVSNLNLEVDIYGGSSIGGLAGYNSGTISNVKVSGEIHARASKSAIGGLVGHNYGTIEKCYSSANISRVDTTTNTINEVGGLVGYNTGTINTSASSGTVLISNGVEVGGLVGSTNGGTVRNSYWTPEKAGIQTSAAGTELTMEEIQKQESYVNWDFSSGEVWTMKEYPELVF